MDPQLATGIGKIKVGSDMTNPVATKDPGWREWLEKYDLWDEHLGEERLYLRYRKFEKIKFDHVPP